MSPAGNNTFLVHTHRPPSPLEGRQHVSMFFAVLGRLFDDVRGGNQEFKVTVDDCWPPLNCVR